MRLVRYGWLAMTVLVLALALLADGATFTTVHHTCSPNNCSGLELTRQQVNELREAGISLTTFALFSAVVTTGVACIFILIAGLIVWRRSTDRMALFTAFTLVLFGPLRRRIQAGIDRRFYRNRYDAALTLAGFGVRLRDEVDLDQLAAELQSVVYETVQLAHVSLWLRTGLE